MSEFTKNSFSYKDPHGYVFKRDGIFYRSIHISYKNQYDHLISSGLYDELTEKKLITPFSEVELHGHNTYKIILPEQLEFVTYPYEWSFTQWKECALTFLKINLISLKYGMLLKDATPFNFCMQKGKLVMFDILSFEFYTDGEPWIAYRQFCECFLSPIALMKYNNLQWGKLFRSSINGFDLTLASNSLAFKSFFNFSCLLHIHLHSSIKNTNSKVNSKGKSFLNKAQLRQLWRSISQTIESWKSSGDNKTLWLSYYEEDIQSVDYLTAKTEFIEIWLDKIRPSTITDVGANTGKFSFIASKYAQKVIAVESDPHSLNLLYNQYKEVENLYSVYADFSDPSPPMGWRNEEKTSLLNRMDSHTTMALAVTHHLRITYNIPLVLIANFFNDITQKYLLIEFVSKTDLKVKAMLANREDVFDDYSLAFFLETFEEKFNLIDKMELYGQERIIYLWEKK